MALATDQLSTAPRARTTGDLSTAKPRSTPVDLSIAAIERRRKASGISLARLLADARMDWRTWRAVCTSSRPVRRSTLERLQRALNRLASGDRETNEGATVLAYRAIIVVTMRAHGLDIVKYAQAMACDFSAEKPQNPEWATAARARRIAMYFLCDVLGVGKAGLAKAIGCSRQNVNQAVAAIEAARDDDGALDTLLNRLTAEFGRAA